MTTQPLRGLRRSVVGRQPRVGEGRDVRGLERVVDGYDAARRRLQVLGVPAVGVDARELAVLAVHVVTGAARTTQAARDQRVHDHLVALADVGDRRPDGVHPPGVLVTDRVRRRHARLLLPLSLEDVEVGAAHPGATDADDDVEGPRGLGDVDLVHLEVLVVADDLDGSHGAHGVVSFGGGVSREVRGTKVGS
jgi:hypothetical protein